MNIVAAAQPAFFVLWIQKYYMDVGPKNYDEDPSDEL